jgi:hypothetical protein
MLDLLMFTSRMRNIFTGPGHESQAIVVSFFGGDPYYSRCAERLAEQCEKFRLSYDICEVEITGSVSSSVRCNTVDG